jgi:hypothetical protein
MPPAFGNIDAVLTENRGGLIAGQKSVPPDTWLAGDGKVEFIEPSSIPENPSSSFRLSRQR